jgi:hypothetical protein
MINAGNTNNYVALVSAPYGFTGAAPYNQSDVPSHWASNNALSPQQLEQKLAYEWLNSHEISGEDSNPPFTSGASGRLIPGLNGGQRIVRGYIRRANYEANDATSKKRLYFMYNPETIVRDYVSYLDQAALDPFNTVYGSKNLVAPPSFMNFRFDLFFDRQDEVSQDMNNPGVFADYQFFDLVVRNVIPSNPNSVSNQIPDNGVMMVNPRDITVVFSPQLSVQGRPINAQVVFEKFSSRMTPIRMRISLEMRVVYIGPMREFSEYTMEAAVTSTSDTVAADDSANFTLTYNTVVAASGANSGIGAYTPSANPQTQSNLVNVGNLANIGNTADGTGGTASSPNGRVRSNALQWAINHVKEGYTLYDNNFGFRGNGVDPSGFLRYADCSSLVWWAYRSIGMSERMGWGKNTPGNVQSMLDAMIKNNTGLVLLSWDPESADLARTWFSVKANRDKMLPGDLIIRDKRLVPGARTSHVAFFNGWADNEGNFFNVFDAAGQSKTPQVGHRKSGHLGWNHSSLLNFENGAGATHIVRPIPLGASSVTTYSTNSPYAGIRY